MAKQCVTIPRAYVLSRSTTALSLKGAYYFSIKNSVTGNTVDVEIDGCGTLATLNPGDQYTFEVGTPDYPFADNTQLNVNFNAGDSILNVIVFAVQYDNKDNGYE